MPNKKVVHLKFYIERSRDTSAIIEGTVPECCRSQIWAGCMNSRRAIDFDPKTGKFLVRICFSKEADFDEIPRRVEGFCDRLSRRSRVQVIVEKVS